MANGATTRLILAATARKDSRLRHKQGLYSAVAATGAVLKRGHDLQRVLAVIDKRPTLVRA